MIDHNNDKLENNIDTKFCMKNPQNKEKLKRRPKFTMIIIQIQL